MSTKKVNIFACGGTGMVSVAKTLSDKAVPTSEVNVVYCDASSSDVREAGLDTESDNLFFPKGIDKDGSGRLKSSNSKVIKDSIPSLLNKHGTTNDNDLNLIVGSASGGTGCVYLLYLTKKLLELNRQVIVILVTADESRNVVKNTMEVMASLEAIPKSVGHPLTIYPIAYTRSSKGHGYKTYAEVEKDISLVLKKLIFLYTNNHDKVDSMDLRHWLKYDAVDSDVANRLNRLFIHNNSSDEPTCPSVDNIMSIISLYPRGTEPNLKDVVCNYIVDGFSNYIDSGSSLHFMLAEDGIARIGETIKQSLKVLDDAVASRSNMEKMSFDVESDDDGFVGM